MRCARALAAALFLAPAAAADTWTSTVPPVATADFTTAVLPVVVDSAFAISDVNVIVTLVHGDVSQLDVRLRHPDGTLVTIFSGLAGTEVLHLCADDEAAAAPAAGSAPYIGTWLPAQPLSAFDGKPAAGTWQLEVYDAVAGGAGEARSVSLAFNGRTFVSTDVPVEVHDFLTAVSSVEVDPALVVEDVDLTVWIDHTCPGDMDPHLQAPDGAEGWVTSWSLACLIPSGFHGTTWDDESPWLIDSAPPPARGRFQAKSPVGPPVPLLSALDGPQAGGSWHLLIPDMQWGDEELLRAWSIHVTGPELCPGEPAAVTHYGSALPGTLGAPQLAASLPQPAGMLSVVVTTFSSVPTTAAVFTGLQSAALPCKGGTLLVDPLFVQPFLVPALSGNQLNFIQAVPPEASLCGASVFLQVLQLDAGAPKGVAFSDGLELLFGG